MLFASLLEALSLEPLLVIVPGHAFVGWRMWAGSAQMEFVETTLIATHSFVEVHPSAQGRFAAAQQRDWRGGCSTRRGLGGWWMWRRAARRGCIRWSEPKR